MLIEESEESIMVRLKKAQAKDKDLREIRDNIEHVVNGFILKNDILHKEVNAGRWNAGGRAEINAYVQVLRQVHERGHFGVNKTEAMVRWDFWFKGMRPNIEKVVLNCINRTLMPSQTKLSALKPEEWYKYLEIAQKFMNATPSRSN